MIPKVNFKKPGCGPVMMDKGEFAIEGLGAQNSIDLTLPRDTCLYSRWKVGVGTMIKPQRDFSRVSRLDCRRLHRQLTGK